MSPPRPEDLIGRGDQLGKLGRSAGAGAIHHTIIVDRGPIAIDALTHS